MGLATALGNVANLVASAIARVIIGEPILFYKAGFADDAMMPVSDPFGLGPLEVTPTSNIAALPPAWTKVMVMVPLLANLPGVRLTLTRPTLPSGDPVAGIVAVQAAVRKFPDTTYFIAEATYALPVGPHGPGDRWSVTLTARKGSTTVPPDPTTPPPDDVPQDQRIAATLQSSFEYEQPVARLNTNGVPLHPEPGNLPQEVFNALFDPSSRPSSLPRVDPLFVMRLYVDRLSYGTARLWTSGYSAEHRFAHVYIPVSNRIGAAGGGVAIGTNGGNGPVAVTLVDFKIWGVQRFVVSPTVNALTDTIGEMLMRVPPFRAVRTFLIDAAFRHLPSHENAGERQQ